jgi:hypothetical protein
MDHLCKDCGELCDCGADCSEACIVCSFCIDANWVEEDDFWEDDDPVVTISDAVDSNDFVFDDDGSDEGNDG